MEPDEATMEEGGSTKFICLAIVLFEEWSQVHLLIPSVSFLLSSYFWYTTCIPCLV